VALINFADKEMMNLLIKLFLFTSANSNSSGELVFGKVKKNLTKSNSAVVFDKTVISFDDNDGNHD